MFSCVCMYQSVVGLSLNKGVKRLNYGICLAANCVTLGSLLSLELDLIWKKKEIALDNLERFQTQHFMTLFFLVLYYRNRGLYLCFLLDTFD